MLGHISGAYAARVTRDLALCSRFDFNIYSYESEWTVGAEWWTRRSKTKHLPEAASADPTLPAAHAPSALPDPRHDDDDIQGVVKARASTTTVRVEVVYVVLLYSYRRTFKDVSLMWEGRIRNLLVSLGIVSNLSNRTKPIKAIGLELSYFSSG